MDTPIATPEPQAPQDPYELVIQISEPEVYFEHAVVDARMRAAGEMKTHWRFRMQVGPDAWVAGVVVCPTGEPVFYVDERDLPRVLDVAYIAPQHRWRMNPMHADELAELTRITNALPDVNPDDALARRTWGIVNVVRERMGMPEPVPCSRPPIIPLLDVPVGGSETGWVVPSEDAKAQPLTLIGIEAMLGRAPRIHVFGHWSRIEVPNRMPLIATVEAELERLDALAGLGANGVAVRPTVGPKQAEMRWLQTINTPYTRVWLI